jgi:hypothetical protein
MSVEDSPVTEPTLALSRGVAQDFWIGPDEDGDQEPISASSAAAYTDHAVAGLIIAQARKWESHAPLSTDEVEQLGLDGTGRGVPRPGSSFGSVSPPPGGRGTK